MSDGSLQVSAPVWMGREEIDRFVASKETWIRQRVLRLDTHRKTNPASYEPGSRLWYLGEALPVHAQKASRNRLSLEEGGFCFHMASPEGLEAAWRRLYSRMAESFFRQKVREWSERTGLMPKGLRHRFYKSRWGCCGLDNVITLNTMLMAYEEALVDYVVVHELAHICHKHHRKPFWELVGRFIPDYRERRARLL